MSNHAPVPVRPATPALDALWGNPDNPNAKRFDLIDGAFVDKACDPSMVTTWRGEGKDVPQSEVDAARAFETAVFEWSTLNGGFPPAIGLGGVLIQPVDEPLPTPDASTPAAEALTINTLQVGTFKSGDAGVGLPTTIVTPEAAAGDPADNVAVVMTKGQHAETGGWVDKMKAFLDGEGELELWHKITARYGHHGA